MNTKEMKDDDDEYEREQEIVRRVVNDDEGLQRLIEEEGKRDIPVYGEIELDDDERSLLKLRPEFAVYDKVTMKDMEKRMEVGMSKM